MELTYVVDGAKTKCSQGIGQSIVCRTMDNTVEMQGKTVLSIADSVPYINIKSFQLCKSPMNPAVVANQGKPVPGTPNICTKWMKGKLDTTIKGEPILNSDCKLECLYGGIIEIVDDGQSKL